LSLGRRPSSIGLRSELSLLSSWSGARSLTSVCVVPAYDDSGRVRTINGRRARCIFPGLPLSNRAAPKKVVPSDGTQYAPSRLSPASSPERRGVAPQTSSPSRQPPNLLHPALRLAAGEDAARPRATEIRKNHATAAFRSKRCIMQACIMHCRLADVAQTTDLA